MIRHRTVIMGILELTILFASNLITIGKGELKEGNSYFITRLQDRPGIYYEYVAPLQLQHVDWKVTVFLEIDKFLEDLPEVHRQFEHVKIMCEKVWVWDKCRRETPAGRVELLLDRARTCTTELKSTVTASELVPPREQVSSRTIGRRAVPLGIIGSLSRSLFGTLDQEDADKINAQIDKLIDDQANLTQLFGKQMHITRSHMQLLHEEYRAESVRVNGIHGKVITLDKTLNTLSDEMRTLMFDTQVTAFVRGLENKIGQYTTTCEHYLRVIALARDGRYDPSIFTNQQLHSIYQEIQLKAPEFEFPVSPSHLRGELLQRIVRVDPVFHQGRFLIAVHIPLLDRNKYLLYRMHSWPVPQGGNETGSAYITPEAKYISVAGDRRTYFLADTDYIKSCEQIEQKYLCSMETPLHDVPSANACEIEMLIRPSTAALHRCDIRIKKTHRSFWTHLPSQGGWLFSLSEREIVHVLCPGLVGTTVTLEHAGIFHLSADCVGRTRSTALTGVRVYEGKERYVYDAGISLNVSSLLPEIMEISTIHGSQGTKDLNDAADPERTWKFQKNEESLIDIEGKIREIGKHRKEQRSQTLWVYGGFLIQGTVIIIVTLLACCRKKIKTIYRVKWPRKKQSEEIYTTPRRINRLSQSLRQSRNLFRKNKGTDKEKTSAASNTIEVPSMVSGLLPRQEAEVNL